MSLPRAALFALGLFAATLLVAPMLHLGHAGQEPPVVLSLPASTLLSSLQKVLPLEVPAQNPRLQGEIIVESIDRLMMHDNIITLHGVLAGHNLTITTNLAGQDLQLRVGSVRLPMTCDLKTRFDSKRQRLLVTPRFSDTGQGAGADGQDPMANLLGSLSNREFPIDLDALETMHIKMGNKSIPITMQTINVVAQNNALVVHLLPRISPSN